MNANKNALGSDLGKIDTHAITPEEYEDIPELDNAFFANAIPMIDGKQATDAAFSKAVRAELRRGRPKKDNTKTLLSIRYSREVVEYFRSTGSGWQVRMDAALKEWVKTHTD
jgi:uncharacterized protein (DUF4415 family)